MSKQNACNSNSSPCEGAMAVALGQAQPGAWVSARSAADVLRLAHALSAPLAGLAWPLRLRLGCEGAQVAPPEPGLLSPFANAVCFFAQALRLAGETAGEGPVCAQAVEAVEVTLPEWSESYEAATAAVAFTWAVSTPGALRTLRFALQPGGSAVLAPEYAQALREALKGRQERERLAFLHGTHARGGALSLVKSLPADCLARILFFCRCELELWVPPRENQEEAAACGGHCAALPRAHWTPHWQHHPPPGLATEEQGAETAAEAKAPCERRKRRRGIAKEQAKRRPVAAASCSRVLYEPSGDRASSPPSPRRRSQQGESAARNREVRASQPAVPRNSTTNGYTHTALPSHFAQRAGDAACEARAEAYAHISDRGLCRAPSTLEMEHGT